MNKNVGPLDAKARIVVGIGCGLLGLIATVLIVEGATRRCLLYRMLGVDRCPVDN